MVDNQQLFGPAVECDDKSRQATYEAGVLLELMDLITQGGVSEKHLRKILAYVERVLLAVQHPYS